MDMGIRGKNVLVVGGSRNIGAAVALAFSAEDCKVTVVARDRARLASVVRKMGGGRKGHGFLAADLLVAGAPTHVARELLETRGKFDIVVHNVGGALGLKDSLGPVDDWETVWRFNAGIAIEMNRLLVRPMKKRRWGRVIHISSISAEAGEPLSQAYAGSIAYAAAKAYLNAYVRGLGRDLAKFNIVVSALMPGAVLSHGKFWDRLRKVRPKAVKEYLERHSAAGRFGKAEEIAPFAVFLASKQASFASGSIVPVDGGRI